MNGFDFETNSEFDFDNTNITPHAEFRCRERLFPACDFGGRISEPVKQR